MSNIYSNDDDIFEDYVEPSSKIEEDSERTIDQVFSDIDSPFKNLLRNSSLKVDFSQAFYNAAHDWTMMGYKSANDNAILDEIVRLTNGEFLYRHRISISREIIVRRKTILNFLNIVLENDNTNAIIKTSKENFNVNFTDTYFQMFFRSFYNIQLHMYWQEVAVYRALCEMVNQDPEDDICDLTKESILMDDHADYINKLYIDFFDKTTLDEKIKENVQKIFEQK